MSPADRHYLAGRACDGCRRRKIRCAPPPSNHVEHVSRTAPSSRCTRCFNLGLECTFDKPQKTRGRKKKRSTAHETEPRLQTVDVAEVSTPAERSSWSPFSVDLRDSNNSLSFTTFPEGDSRLSRSTPSTNATQRSYRLTYLEKPHSGSINSPHASGGYPTDLVCSRDVCALILDDYLRLMYPVVPVVHRPSFVRQVQEDLDTRDQVFLGLVLSILALTVAAISSRFRIYQDLHPPLRLESRRELIEKCASMALSLRGPTYFDELNHAKWATSFLLRLAFYHIGQHNRSRIFVAESMQIGRILNFHNISDYEGLGCIDIQLRKKAFWLLFYSHVHGRLQSLRRETISYLDLDILDSIHLQDLLPIEVDDEHIFDDHVDTQPTDRFCLTSAFIIHSRVFWAALRSVQSTESNMQLPESSLLDYIGPNDAKIVHLKARLHELKYILDDIVPRLRQWVPYSRESHSSLSENYSRHETEVESQVEVTRGNIHVTHLWLQIILLDQLDALSEGQTPAQDHDSPSFRNYPLSWSERDEISRQLLHVLHSISISNLEPNGITLTEKIRDVAVSLLGCPYPPDHEQSKRARTYVQQFAEILTSLGVDPVHTSNTQSWIDTDRFRKL